MNTFGITREEREGSKLVTLEFELIKDYKEVYYVEFYKIDEGYDNFCIRVYKTESRELSDDTQIARAYTDSDLGSMLGDELNVEDNEELTKAILDKIAERIRVVYIQQALSISGELTEVSLNGYFYNISHVYDVVLDDIVDDETVVEAYLLDKDTMCVSGYDFSKEDLLNATQVVFFVSKEI